MPELKLLPLNRSFDVSEGTTLLDALRANSVILDAPCNGLGTCGKCKVRVAPLRGQSDQGLSGRVESLETEVLACETVVRAATVVWLPEQHTETRVLLGGTGGSRSRRSEAGGDERDRSFGIAVDIGTTTLVLALIDRRTGEAIATLGSLNPQTQYGHDVLSRIQHGSTAQGLQQLRQVLVDELNRLLLAAVQQAGLAAADVTEACLSGNTTMLHLITGTDPSSLGRYPYKPGLSGHELRAASEIGLQIAPTGSVYLPPIFDAFVGADITAGVLATDLHRLEGATLFIDIGTNGEMVLAVNGELTATSTAAGPAFEGMNITCGMRAMLGAIERVRIASDGALQICAIGNGEPKGLCGSGLLDAVGQLVSLGIVNPSGRLARPGSLGVPALDQRLVKHQGRPAFHLSGSVILTQSDIRQVQLAKGAVRAGIDQLLTQSLLAPSDVRRVLIAGSFGAHLSVDSLVAIGLLPPELADRVELVGNTSRTGAEALLRDRSVRAELAEVTRRAQTLDLAHTPNFDQRFVSCLAFPASASMAAA